MVMVVMIGAAAFYVVTQGSDSDDALTVAPDELTPEDLEPLLFSSDDVGEGFSVETSGLEDPDDGPLEGASAECQAALDGISERRSGKQRAHAEFRHDEDRKVVEQDLGLIVETNNDLDLLRDAYVDCTGPIDTSSEGVEYTLELTTEEISGIGEDAMVLIATITDHPNLTNPAEFYTIIFGRGGVAADITVQSGVNVEESTPENEVALPADRDLARELAEKLDAKIQEGME